MIDIISQNDNRFSYMHIFTLGFLKFYLTFLSIAKFTKYSKLSKCVINAHKKLFLELNCKSKKYIFLYCGNRCIGLCFVVLGICFTKSLF